MSKTQALRPQSQCTVRHASAWLLCPEATLNATHLYPPPILGTPSVNVDMIAAGMSERHLQLTTEGDTNQAVCPLAEIARVAAEKKSEAERQEAEAEKQKAEEATRKVQEEHEARIAKIQQQLAQE